MIARREKDSLSLFERRTGMSCVLTERELSLVLDYAESGVRMPFIGRLFDLGILVAGIPHRAAIQDAWGETGTERRVAFDALHVELTTFCPLSCPQCYRAGTENAFMDLSRFRSLVEEADALKVFQIALGGSEPMAYPYLLDAVRVVADTEMAATLTTSGWGLNAAVLEQLREAGIRHVQVSLNAVDERISGRSRDGHEHAMQALRLLSAANLSFGVNWVARKDNLPHFGKVAALAAELGADNVNVLRYKPSPAERFTDAALSLAETERLAHEIAKMCGVKIKVDSAYSLLLCYLHGEAVDRARCGCGAGRSFVSVTPEGRFKPCSHLPLATESAGIEAYARSNVLRGFLQTAAHVRGLCGSCRYRDCCGGCRAVCASQGGAFDAGEEACIAYKTRG